MISVADDFNASGVSGRTLVRKITKSVCCFKSIGCQKVSYEWKQLHNGSNFTTPSTKINMQRERRDVCAVPGTIFGGTCRQKLTWATFPNNNSINLKHDIVSKQFPCWQKDTQRIFQQQKKRKKGLPGRGC
jgi:hypothetical protein